MKKWCYRFSGLMLVIAAVTIGGTLVSQLFDRVFASWAFESDGDPALIGSWVGSLITATGRPRGVVLEIRLPEPKGGRGFKRDWRSDPYGEIAGTARVCDEHGQVRTYTIDGEPENRQATRLYFHASPSETPTPEGLVFSWIKGTWDRANKLNLTVQFYWEKDGAAIAGDQYPDTQAAAALAMSRGGDAGFQTLCVQVKQHSAKGT